MHNAVPVSLLTILLAGCTASTPSGIGLDGTADVPPPPTVLEEAAAPLGFVDCIQFHTTFAARGEDFQVPEGFTVVTDETGMVALRVTPTTCEGAAHMLVSVAVVPPADLALEGHGHQYVLEAYADEMTALWLAAIGIEAAVCGCHLDFYTSAGPVFHAIAQDSEYTMRLALAPSDGAFDVGATAWFFGAAPTRVTSTPGASVNLGIGAVSLQYAGPGGAPPVFPGHLAHGVQDLSYGWEVA